MKLFISYARVDKHYCSQIVDTLDVHDVWYDQRLHVGQQWWDEIQRRLTWCDGLIYLLSPDSVRSEYCRQEFNIAQALGKHILPVLIHAGTSLPEEMAHIQYADLSRGLTAEAVKQLLNSIYIVERQGQPTVTSTQTMRVMAASVPTAVAVAPADGDPYALIDEVAGAMDAQDFDRAVYLLKQARASGYESRFINIEAMLHDAEAALEQQAYLREAEREYMPILALIRRPRTREMGFQAFMEFRSQFPDYDPENIAAVCSTMMIPMLEWCTIPGGETTVEYDDRRVTYDVRPFQISKYPVTNAQYQVFVDAEDGYANPDWWTFSPAAAEWRSENPHPLPPKFAWGDHPRANICWYEAVAFCRWFSASTGMKITLPTEQQWQRAAQGDDDRLYPWGNRFERSLSNTRDSKLRMTTPVDKYPEAASPFGVFDLAGNVWEWCRNTNAASRKQAEVDGAPERAVRGGSFISVPQRCRNNFHFYLNPLYRYATIGFRVIAEL